MYLEYFDLQQAPFSITPDPEFVYLSEKHQESLAHLIYGVTRGGGAGFVQLTGEVGTGKTTISRLFLQKLPEDTQAALILNPNITPIELLENIFKELKIPTRCLKGKLNAMVEKLNEHLLQWWGKGKNTLVLIDEAQNIPRDTLEQLRLLTNLETDQQKLLQIILIGQPELKQLMQRKDLRQLAQRITSRFHLQPLSKEETHSYIKHRVAVSGGRTNLFTDGAINKIHQQTDGIPRLINVLCDRALLVAFTKEEHQVKAKHIRQAIAEINPEAQTTWSFTWVLVVTPLLLLAAWFLSQPHDGLTPTTDKPSPEVVVTEPPAALLLPSLAVSWQHYLSLWGEDHALVWNQTTCPSIEQIGMGCMLRQGNLAQIKKQNTPVLLKLNDGQLALLKSSKDNSLVFFTQSGDQTITASQLDTLWFGHYFVLWPLAVELIDDTMSSAAQDWALSVAQVIDNNTNLRSSELSDWIIDFQRANGLVADGIIGQETQMALSLNAYQGPKLTD